MLTSLTVKPLLFACAVLLASTTSFAYLSYKFYGDKQEAEERLLILSAANLSLQKSIEKQRQACIIDVKSTLEFQEDKKELETHKEEVIQRIDKLTSSLQKEEASDEKSVVNIDAELPPSLRSLLDSTFDSIQRKPTHHP